jgi:hypothetical protein
MPSPYFNGNVGGGWGPGQLNQALILQDRAMAQKGLTSLANMAGGAIGGGLATGTAKGAFEGAAREVDPEYKAMASENKALATLIDTYLPELKEKNKTWGLDQRRGVMQGFTMDQARKRLELESRQADMLNQYRQDGIGVAQQRNDMAESAQAQDLRFNQALGAYMGGAATPDQWSAYYEGAGDEGGPRPQGQAPMSPVDAYAAALRSNPPAGAAPGMANILHYGNQQARATGPQIVEESGVRFYQTPSGGWEPVPAGALPKTAPMGAPLTSPEGFDAVPDGKGGIKYLPKNATVLKQVEAARTAKGDAAAKAQRLLQERGKHESEIAAGDNRYGANILSRDSRVKAIDAELSGLFAKYPELRTNSPAAPTAPAGGGKTIRYSLQGGKLVPQ